MIEINDNEFELLRQYLHKAWGMDIPDEKRYLFHTRLEGFLKEEGCLSFGDFYRRVKDDGSEMLNKRLIEAMTTNETTFFRDGHPYDALLNHILPEIINRKKDEAMYMPPRVRIWSAGCSAGHEAYSLAITIHKWLSKNTSCGLTMDNFSILATDISNRVIERAKAATYSEKELGRWIPGYIKKEYFENSDGEMRVVSEVRSIVKFDEVNLAEPFENLGFFDLILCRNVVIYFSFDLKQKIISQFCKMLYPGGVLMLGASETLYMLSNKFNAIHKGQTIYYIKK